MERLGENTRLSPFLIVIFLTLRFTEKIEPTPLDVSTRPHGWSGCQALSPPLLPYPEA